MWLRAVSIAVEKSAGTHETTADEIIMKVLLL